MKVRNQNNFINDLLFETHADDLNYVYRGVFNSEIANYILSLAERNILQSRIKGKTRKRVFHLMVESIQNITRHQDYDDDLSKTSFFAIQKSGSTIFITTGNIIDTENVEVLDGKLQKLNELSKEELTQYYLTVLNDGTISSKGGAGLGLIEIIRKSGNKLLYKFKELSENKSFIYMQSYIETNPQEPVKREASDIYTFDYIQKIHTQIISDNIELLYCNIFEQSNLVKLISILKSQEYSTLVFKKRIISTMIELLQNIISHGKKLSENQKFSQGIFYITRNKNIFHLNTINYILNENTAELKQKLDHLNKLNDAELDKLYNNQLFDFSERKENAGLGFIEMRMKSRNKLTYDFTQIDDTTTLFLIKVTFTEG